MEPPAAVGVYGTDPVTVWFRLLWGAEGVSGGRNGPVQGTGLLGGSGVQWRQEAAAWVKLLFCENTMADKINWL